MKEYSVTFALISNLCNSMRGKENKLWRQGIHSTRAHTYTCKDMQEYLLYSQTQMSIGMCVLSIDVIALAYIHVDTILHTPK